MDEPLLCPRCRAIELPVIAPCTHCGFDVRTLRLYSSGSFLWLGLLFSPVLPGSLAAANWKRMGEPGRGRRWRWGTVGGLAAVFLGLCFLPEGQALGRAVGLVLPPLMNVPLVKAIRTQQDERVETFVRLGARKVSGWRGLPMGILYLLLAIVVAIAAYFPFYSSQPD